jgi:uncharacterized protein YeaO (DUF488 family)
MLGMANVTIKRIYEAAAESDGYRVLVDRLWPRGVAKEKAKLDIWLKEVGPSDGLRKWFNHDPAKYAEFKQRYEKELADNPAYAELQEIVATQPVVTLLYSAHDPEHNQAQVLLENLTE